MKKILTLSFCIVFITGIQAQLTVNTGLSGSQLATLLTGFGVSITGVTVTGSPNSYGEFSGTSEIPISHGLMLSTGFIDTALCGPNNTGYYGTDVGTIGDMDLTADAGVQTYNACVIEFDCIPAGDTLQFNFGFGSEEYPEFVGVGFNDIFAIYITDSLGNVSNAALVPSTSTPVSVNSVNATTNSSYYIDNATGVHIQFDGLTQNLQAFSVVNPGSSYHIKIAIADAGDGIYDSGVLLEAFSFRSTPATMNMETLLASMFRIYPVPAQDYIRIEGSTQTIATGAMVYDALGRVVINTNLSSSANVLDVSSLSAGIYGLTIVTDKGNFTKKILIQ